MCGRFENTKRQDWMMEKFAEFDLNLLFKSDTDERKFENIAPTEPIVSITLKDENFFGENNKWGIKFKEDSPLIFNSRIETISEKAYWKTLFEKNRCIIPMTAFYEWKKAKPKKIPYRISLKSEEIFFVAGIYYNDKDGKKKISLITTQPNSFMEPIHNRMPVVLHLEEAAAYLKGDSQGNLKKCSPYSNSDNMEMEAVDI